MVEVQSGESVSYSDFAVNSLTTLGKCLWLPEAQFPSTKKNSLDEIKSLSDFQGPKPFFKSYLT